MGYPTPIEWTDATWNVVGGCSIKSPGCINCYAQQLCGTRLAHHLLYAGTTDIVKGRPVFNGEMTVLPDDHSAWTWPLRWRGAKRPRRGAGARSMVFVGDMSDLFHERRSFLTICRVLAVMALADHLDFQVLTKRPDVMHEILLDGITQDRVESMMGEIAPEHWCRRELKDVGGWPLRNVWCGTSVERQQEANERRMFMQNLSEAGWVTFVSYEPALGLVDWTDWRFLSWLISGGESGRREPRPTHPDWHWAAHDFCAAFRIPYLFKQWGEWLPIGLASGASGLAQDDIILTPCGTEMSWEDFERRQRMRFDDRRAYVMRRVGKGVAGRRLDGRCHDAWPMPISKAASSAAAIVAAA
jgi:protein gp37